MNLKENIKEGMRSIRSNKLRTILTASIISIGITSLVGILTAIEGIQSSIDSTFSNLGANTFDIESLKYNNGTTDGKKKKVYPPIQYEELVQFKEAYKGPGTISINTVISWNMEAKYKSNVSNPNLSLFGGDEHFLTADGYNIGEGRSFSQSEIDNGVYVCVIGNQVRKALFKNNEKPIGKKISFSGAKYKVIDTIKKQGGVSGNTGADSRIIIPLVNARIIGTDRSFGYKATAALADTRQLEDANSISTGLMRAIRKYPLKQENSFDIVVSKSLAERISNITGYLRSSGFTIGFITLLGASIGLMNIMLVPVTERTKEIGIRKALGATPLKIKQQFLIESIVICQMGGIGGIIFGILIGNLTSTLLFKSGFIVPWIWILVAVLIGITVGLASGYFPAHRTARLDPINSLKFE